MDMPDLSGPQLIADGGLTTELEAQARTRSVPRTYPSAAALIGVPMRAAACHALLAGWRGRSPMRAGPRAARRPGRSLRRREAHDGAAGMKPKTTD